MRKAILLGIGLWLSFVGFAQKFDPSGMDRIYYGVAYYYEYMPVERLEEDVKLMKECGINVVRICESTWSYMEPQDGKFNFDWLGRVLDTMHQNGIRVIIGTPTYAIPSWMALKHPEIMAVTRNGQNKYGHRQQMDITNPYYRIYSERIIRKLMAFVKDHPAVIGYQLDNETKHYGTAGENVQKAFRDYLKEKFKTPEALNQAYGLNYWSNSIKRWDDLPSMLGTVNGSLGGEFSKFQRLLVTEFLAWQAAIVREYKRPDQFMTQNFDLDWRNGSYAIQGDVDHFEACAPLDIAGIDIYHDTQDKLDGVSISLGGAVARSMKQSNYLVMETQAQSILGPTDQQLVYPGQLRLQAYSHLACGANMVAYWPWHSIHNSVETYWKGILSHDMEPNPTFYEAQQIAREFKELSGSLVNLKKDNKVAIYFSNESLTALQWFGISRELGYNDIVRAMFKTLYEMNIECDFVDHTSTNLDQYKVLFVPPLYTATDVELQRLNDFASKGGQVVYAFKSGFTNEDVQVRMQRMPAVLREACGFSYQQFTGIDKLMLKNNPFGVSAEENVVSDWAELLVPETCQVLASYDHPYWGKYAAITRNTFGKGMVTYLGAWPSQAILKSICSQTIQQAGLETADQQLAFPLIVKHGINQKGNRIHYYFNYSGQANSFSYPYATGTDLHRTQLIEKGQNLTLEPWGLIVIEER